MSHEIRKISALLKIFLILPQLAALSQPTLEIWEIQGSGVSSPYENERIRSNGNIVTAVNEDGFFMQTPPVRSDNRPATSDGIYVFTGYSSGLTAGDSVSVSGIIREQFGLTEFSDVSLLQKQGTVEMLPPPIELDASFPGTSPASPAALERVEGMRLRITAGVTAPTNRFGEFAVTAAAERPFREPGIVFPGRQGLPVWDGNPEIIVVDPDGIGASDYLRAATGDSLTARGVLTYRFGRYTLLPETYQIKKRPVEERPVRARQEGEYTLASLNTYLFLKEEDNYPVKVEKLARYIIDLLQAPDILALQEIGSLNALQELADKINEFRPGTDYRPYLGEASGFFHSAYLVRPRIEVVQVTALQTEKRFSRGGPLHGRPPLLLVARLGSGTPVSLLNLHLRSLIGIEDPVEGSLVRQLRFEQSLEVARLVEDFREPNLFLIGDFNAFPFSDGYVDVFNQISGGASLGALFPVRPIVTTPLTDLSRLTPPDQRYSFVRAGSAQQLDHCLATDLSGLRVEDLQFARGNADAPFPLSEDPTTPLRSSDHDGFVVYLRDLSVANKTTVEELKGITIIPNPVQTGRMVQLETTDPGEISVTLLSNHGKNIATWLCIGKGSHQLPLPVTLSAGYYLVRIQTKKGSVTLPLILQP